MSRPTRISLIAIAVIWIGCVVAGFAALQQYSFKEGDRYSPSYAAGFYASHGQGKRPLLVMAVHPRCPCSRASLGELGDLLARSQGTCDAIVLQYVPSSQGLDWPAPTSLALGGVSVKVIEDPGSRIAAALGAATSGHAVFIDSAGTVLFSGGLTRSRGHRGRAPGQDAILALLAGENPTRISTPVYGCALEPECRTPGT